MPLSSPSQHLVGHCVELGHRLGGGNHELQRQALGSGSDGNWKAATRAPAM